MSYDLTSGIPSEPNQKPKTIQARFRELDGKRTSLLTRCEEYALWTLPYIFPRVISESEAQERAGPIDSTGAQAVNSLSNKVVMTLFQAHAPFFRIMAQSDLLQELKEKSKQGDKEAQVVLDTLDEALSISEKKAMRELDYTHFRTEATTVAKRLIITGNALLYHPEGKGTVQGYSLRDYVVVRDLNGEVIELITKDSKPLDTFSKDVQAQIMKSPEHRMKSGNSTVCLYTRLLLKDGKFHMTQAADSVALDSTGSWPKDEMPWIVLTWNLVRGENYGRGLVEDYAGAFHGLSVLSSAFVDAVGVAADIKWLVNPASVLDVVHLNNAESGTYHSGMEGDITAVQLNKQMDLAMVKEMIQEWRTQIGKAFLMFAAVQRDAERVTAEEIRAAINDLDTAHGGIYSRLASEWQYPTAKLLLKRIKVNIGDGRQIYPVIITGLDSLSRAGDMENFRMLIADLQATNEIPDDIRGALSPMKLIQYCAIRRGVEYSLLLKTPDEQQEELQSQMAMAEQAKGIEAEAAVAEEAGKAMVKPT